MYYTVIRVLRNATIITSQYKQRQIPQLVGSITGLDTMKKKTIISVPIKVKLFLKL